MGNYDANLCTVTVDGRFITGFEDGTMVSTEKDEENFKSKEEEFVYYISLLETSNVNYVETLEDGKYDVDEYLDHYNLALDKLENDFSIKVD